MLVKRLAIVCAAAAAALTMSIGPGSATTGGHLWNESPSTNLCLAIAWGGTSSNTMQMSTCAASSVQSWHLSGPFGGYTSTGAYVQGYWLIDDAGYCLSGYGSGAKVYAVDCDENSLNQFWQERWEKKDGTYDYYEIYLPLTGACLSVSGGSTRNGAPVITWTCQDTLDQQWGGPGTTVG
jgi:hypothetical protein